MVNITFMGVPAIPTPFWAEYGVAVTTCVPSPKSEHVKNTGPLFPQKEKGAWLSVRYLIVLPYPNATDFTALPTKVALMLKEGVIPEI
jgi:hypothetical protein